MEVADEKVGRWMGEGGRKDGMARSTIFCLKHFLCGRLGEEWAGNFMLMSLAMIVGDEGPKVGGQPPVSSSASDAIAGLSHHHG
jgi:hypothetical protein